MNERIKELYLHAFPPSLNDSTVCRMSAGKFAELIVRECVTVMYDNAIERKVPPDIDKTPLQYAIAIKEHFGVEE